MPDAETPEQKAARESDETRDRRLAESITNGLNAGLKPVIERLAERERSAPAPIQSSPAVTIVRPTEEALADALIDGNKQEYARLLRLQRQADQQENQRAIGNLATQGGAAFGSVAKLSAEGLPHYKRFKKEIDAEIETFQAGNPGAIVTPDHYKIAHDIVRSRHFDELLAESREEQVRAAREKESALLPDNSHVEEELEKEPATLAEALAGDWKKEFRPKQRGVGSRTDDEELRKMGYEGGIKDFLADRKKNAAIEEEMGSGMGLDRDWDKEKGEWIN